jgi:hypothetical protein
MSEKKTKKGQPIDYRYVWEGHFNLIFNGTRIHLHSQAEDRGLEKQEEKLQLAKDKLDFFLKQIKLRYKTPAKKFIRERHWLNDIASGYTGYVSINIDEIGGGTFALADCHKSIMVWCDVWLDDKGQAVKKDPSRDQAIKSLESISKSLGRAIKAIQELRKFFQRELENPNE